MQEGAVSVLTSPAPCYTASPHQYNEEINKEIKGIQLGKEENKCCSICNYDSQCRKSHGMYKEKKATKKHKTEFRRLQGDHHCSVAGNAAA